MLGALDLELRVVARIDPHPVVLEMSDRIDRRIEKIAVVGNQQQRAGILLEPVLQPEHRIQIQVIGRFVEQQQVGTAHQRLCEVEPHPPAAGKRRDRF